MSWAERYVGHPYEDQTFNCAHFVTRARRECFGHEVNLPGHATSIRGRDAQIRSLKSVYARPLCANESPEDGDAVLMRMKGRKIINGHHIGLFCLINEKAYTVHCLKGFGVCLHAFAQIENYGLQVTGVYRWI